MMIADSPSREDWAFEELQEEAEELRRRINRFRTSLGPVLRRTSRSSST